MKGLNELRWNDQNKIRKLGGFEVDEADEGNDEESDDESYVIAEYAKSGRSKCKGCSSNIANGVLRLGIDDGQGKKMLGYYHPDCIKFPSSVTDKDDIDGFKKLKAADKKTVEELLKKHVDEMSKNKKEGKKSLSPEKTKERELAQKLWKVKDKISKKYNANELKAILKYNDQQYNCGRQELIDRVADGEIFGALPKCKICNYRLYKESGMIMCNGHISEYTRCTFSTSNLDEIERLEWKYPSKEEIENLIDEIKEDKEKTKFKHLTGDSKVFENVTFCIVGTVPKKNDLITKIKSQDGNVATSLDDEFDYILTTYSQVSKAKKTANINKALESGKPILDASAIEKCIDYNKSINDVSEAFVIWKDDEAIKVDEDKLKEILGKPRKLKKMVIPEMDSMSCYYGRGSILVENGIVYAITLNVTDLTVGQSGRNSYYTLQCIVYGKRYFLFTRWGRIGQEGNYNEDEYYSKEDMLDEFQKKFYTMTKNTWNSFIYGEFKKKPGKYFPVELDSEEDEEDEGVSKAIISSPMTIGCKLDVRVQELIKLLFNEEMITSQMSQMNINTEKMPLGKLSKKRIAKGFEILKKIEEDLSKEETVPEIIFSDYTNQFYTQIPHDFGNDRPVLINNKKILHEKYELLNVLGDIEIAARMLETKTGTKHPLEEKYEQLKNNIEPLDKNSAEWETISQYVHNSGGSRKFTILDIYKIDRHGEKNRFSKFDHIENRKLLWHGSSVAVFPAILSTGLKIMPHSGGRVGKGLYFADMLEKSSSYCVKHGKIGLVLLNEIVLGNIHKIYRDDPTIRKPPQNYDSVLACGHKQPDEKSDYIDKSLSPSGHPVIIPSGSIKKTNVNSSFIHNEFLVYDEGQCHMRYLLKLEW